VEVERTVSVTRDSYSDSVMRRSMDGNQPNRSPSSEGDFCSDEEDNSNVGAGRRLRYPIPQSHWFPRAIAFGQFRPSGGRPKQDVGQREVSEKARGRDLGQREGSGQGRLLQELGQRRAGAGAGAGGRLHIQVTRPLPVRLTQEIVDTYQLCNPSFEYSEVRNPKRFLTHPSVALSNNGLDNANYDLILYFGQTLVNDDHTRRYVVKDLVGCGAFGQVAKCLILETNEYVAVKIIKNQRAYSMQASVEVGILHLLNTTDRRNKHHVVRSFEHFSFEGHLCIVFELLSMNLFELLKTNNLKGIPLRLVRDFTSQLVDALTLLHDTHVIHCDLKPENVLLTSMYEAQIKLIDFGSACIEPNTVYTYIQSRFYRSPEVVLGHAYSTAIDMWSLGCVAAELFLGLPLFPGQCPYDLLAFIIEKLRVQPPDHILQRAVGTSKFFKVTSAAPQSAESRTSGHSSVYQFLTPEENEAVSIPLLAAFSLLLP